VDPVHLIVYSDYLCPWCYNAAVRMRRLEEDFGDALRIEWRSFLLRPKPRAGRDLEKFRAYTQSWQRPGEQDDAGEFCPWRGDAGPPTHSVPPHQVAKAAARLGDAAFRRMHERLLRAYFSESRDVTDPETLRELWVDAQLPEAAFGSWKDPQLLGQVHDEHREALEVGVSGVPAVRMVGIDAVVLGAQPLETYRRWVERFRAKQD
jgi:predicted DsbA family dithiol-disulfide isomerase